MGVKISELPASSSWAASDLLELDNGGTSRSISNTQLFTGAFPTVGQLTFPASQSASAGANTLDDYEEGTWTIGLQADTSGTISLDGSNTFANYTKIGNRVLISAYTLVSSVSSPVGGLTVTGLPFTSSSLYLAAAACFANTLNAAAITTIVARFINSATTMDIFRYAAGSINDDVAGFTQTNSEFYLGGHYKV